MTPCTYVVEGTGRFPLDVLPDEQAWPRNLWDAAAMSQYGSRRCEMQAARHPNERRWRDAGWTVKRVDVTRM